MMSERWKIADCPGHAIDGDRNTCTHEHLPGILYTHEDERVVHDILVAPRNGVGSRRMTTTTPAYTMQVELMDPFGTIIGRGEVHIDEQVYQHDTDAKRLATTQAAMRVGKYVQQDPPGSGLLASWMRLTRA